MQIESFIELVDGDLQNNPSINSFDKFVFEAKKVKRGDLFISTSNSDIDEAIKNGAYGIVFEDDIEIKDEEIAWIKVSSIKTTLTKYLRYFLLEKGVIVYYFNENMFDMSKNIAITQSILYLSGDIISDFKKILLNKTTFIISNDKEFLEKIYPMYKIVEEEKELKIIRSSIFKSSFIYKDIYYKGIKIPTLHQKQLQKILAFFSKYKIAFDIEKLNYTKNFYPIFINSNLEEVDFGESSKVLIFAKNSKYIQEDIIYLKKNTKWAKSLIFIPSSLIIDYSVEIYSGYRDLINLLKKDFNFAIVYGDKDEFLEELNQFYEKKDKANLLF